jgi:predicted dehydrogenase
MKVLVVGLGSIAKKHIDALRTLEPNCTIYALRSSKRANPVQDIVNIYNIDDLKIEVDFAIISNPTSLHFETIKCLAKKKLPLFIEKPALHSLENAAELIELVEHNNVVNYVACNLRFHPCIIFLKETILKEERNINELNVYCGSYLPDWRPALDFRKTYSSNPNMGGGVHLDLFHELDYTTWLFGMPNRATSILRSVSSLEIDAMDYANYTLEYKTFTANIVLNYYRRKAKRIIEIVFDNETLIIDLINNCIIDDNGKIIFVADNFVLKDTYVAQLSYFTTLLAKNQNPFNSLRESIDILKIVLQNE